MNFHGSSTSPYIIFSLSWTLLVSFNFLHSSKMSRRCTKTLLPWPRYTFFHRFMPGILRYISRRRSSVISFRITAFISFKVTYMTFRCYLFFRHADLRICSVDCLTWLTYFLMTCKSYQNP